MDIIKMARELGKAIQEEERYKAYYLAKEVNDKDEELQALIGEFNLKRFDLNMEMSKPDKNAEKLKELDIEIKDLYGKIMANKNMELFNNVKNEMDDMLSKINTIITMSANGEDPETCSAHTGCSPDGCSSCGGCH